MATFGNIWQQKNIQLHQCEICDFTCSKIGDWKRHISTVKHKMATNGNKWQQNTSKYAEKNIQLHHFTCDICGKEYKDRSGLWKHKKKCFIVEEKESDIIFKNNTTELIDKNVLIDILKNNLKNQEVMENLMLTLPDVVGKLVENIPKMGNQANNNNSFNNHTFNIQMFLNEHCKNAMNLTDFINSLPITTETYDNTIENGLTKTIANMVVDGLNNLDVLERPIHCTDSTRKILYVKEDNKWEKDNELYITLDGIKKIALKQRTMINKWQDANSGWNIDDNLQTRLTTLVCNSMTDIENDSKETNKIIRAISKNVYLDNEIKKNYLNNI